MRSGMDVVRSRSRSKVEIEMVGRRGDRVTVLMSLSPGPTVREGGISELVARVFLILALVLAGRGGEGRAPWPRAPTTLIVPCPAGGPSDLLGRLLAAELAPKLGKNVIVENHIGAVGNNGISAGARAEPDGYTLVVVTNIVLINPSVS